MSVSRKKLDGWVEAEKFVSPEHQITVEEDRDRLRKRLQGAVGNTGLPQFSGSWEQVGELEGWEVYIVHDSCHDDGEGFVADRNTVIALSSTKGLWRIIGREIPYDFARDLARGKH